MNAKKNFGWFLVPITLAVVCAFGLLRIQGYRKPLGEIEFFGYKGLDVEAVRAHLPIHEGDAFPPLVRLIATVLKPASEGLKRNISEKVKEAIGRDATDVSSVCCDSKQRWMVYIGVPGKSSTPVLFNPFPSDSIQLPQEALKLAAQLESATVDALMKGSSSEDRSQGYSLPSDPNARKKALEMRNYALRNEDLIFRVLASSSNANHRAIAAQALGYGRQSNEQIDALVHACLDPDDVVRNDSIRALVVRLEAKPELAQRIPAEPFVRLVKSGLWTDRNKASFLLVSLTKGRDPAILGQLRADALDSLVEMARWRNEGHASAARLLLGRIAGIDENHLYKLIESGQVDAILAALTPVR